MKFTIVKKGYDTQEVDAYVALVEDKLSEYRNLESAISNSIITAEIIEAGIIKEAKEKAEKLIADANFEVLEQVEAIKKMIVCEKKALKEFCSEYDAVVNSYFTANSAEITAPLKEKLVMIENFINEFENPPEAEITEGDEAEEPEEPEEPNEQEMAGKPETADEPKASGEEGSDPFGEIKNYF